MNVTLAEKLVTKGVLTLNTEVEAAYLAPALGGVHKVLVTEMFMVGDIVKTSNGALVFSLVSTNDGSTRQLLAENITKIDGMDPARFAAVYNVKPDGNDAAVGKRRGRRPKVREQLNG